ncbi:MAG: peptidoglycan DD-metalloendopeptidase family protein [Thermoleophilaceae bacterium]|nr:peptidoglycan DD-metalloendopeptidase family protein [Thermoleophilaceae bacterium]
MVPSPRVTRGICTTLALALAPVGVAQAATSQNGGGVGYTAVPAIVKVKCIQACDKRGRVQGGGSIALGGRNLAGVQKVVFLGGSDSSDDVPAVPVTKSDKRVVVTVPLKAPSGPVAAQAGEFAKSAPSVKKVSVVPPPPPTPQTTLTPVSGPRDTGAPQVETGTSVPQFFIGSAQPVTFSYRLSAPASVKVDLVDAATGTPVQTFTPGNTAAGVIASVKWDGLATGQPAPEGRYAFRLTAQTGSAVAKSAQVADPNRDAFDFHHNLFPIAAKHEIPPGGATKFGAGRGGRSHQGQDVLAKCGVPLVAARGGTVTFSKSQGLAGNYLVIKGDATDTSYMYAHLQSPSPFKVGDRVATGQEIGKVGRTGNATACLLHLELWRGAYQQGGSPFDPLPMLKAWDAYS